MADDSVAAEILASAFVDDPTMSWVFPERRHEKLRALFGFIVGDALEGLESVHVLEDGRAAAAWTPPGTPDWDDARNLRFMQAVGGVFDGEDAERLATLDEASRKVHPHEPHWYLGILGARPEAHGTGAGTQLLGRCLSTFVDRDGLPAYLESSNPRNVTLYLRHGFEIIGDIPIADGVSMTAMWRPAVTPR
ncbi:MAG TPA: GNAT family N-acetyltransferase [Acidimicrobiales bacterium]|nr:GNAT family N-acetyltransferase [Acidimicrobiales bacterium]